MSPPKKKLVKAPISRVPETRRFGSIVHVRCRISSLFSDALINSEIYEHDKYNNWASETTRSL